jgi:hypothetical protein
MKLYLQKKITFNFSAKDWLFFLIDTLSHEKFTKIIITLWAILGAKRKAIHNEILQSPLAIYGFISNYLAVQNLIQTMENLECKCHQ